MKFPHSVLHGAVSCWRGCFHGIIERLVDRRREVVWDEFGVQEGIYQILKIKSSSLLLAINHLY